MGKGAMVVEQRAVDADPVSAFKRHGGGDHRMPRKRVPRTVLAHHHTACTLTLVRVLRRVCVCVCPTGRIAQPDLSIGGHVSAAVNVQATWPAGRGRGRGRGRVRA